MSFCCFREDFMDIKVLSLKEPWATLIASGVKKIETRSWKTTYRGELYIHASQGQIDKNDENIKHLLEYIPNTELSYGNIICKCNLVDCIYMDEEFLISMKKNNVEYECGVYSVRKICMDFRGYSSFESQNRG